MYDKFLNIAYEKNHRNFELCDCYGICYLFNKEILKKDIPIYLNQDIVTHEQISSTLSVKKSDFFKVTNGKEKIGDIVMMCIKGMAIHVGVVLQNGLMLHIMEGKQAAIESYKSTKWKNKVDSFYRYESTSKKTNI